MRETYRSRSSRLRVAFSKRDSADGEGDIRSLLLEHGYVVLHFEANAVSQVPVKLCNHSLRSILRLLVTITIPSGVLDTQALETFAMLQ